MSKHLRKSSRPSLTPTLPKKIPARATARPVISYSEACHHSFPPPNLLPSISPEDQRDKTLMAICATLAHVDNQALCIKELVDVCRDNNFHALGGSTPTGTLNTAIRNHLNRSAGKSTLPILSRHILSGEASDERLAPAIGAAGGANAGPSSATSKKSRPVKEKTYLRNKNGTTRKGVSLWFLSDWTGYENPFVRQGLQDVAIVTESTATLAAATSQSRRSTTSPEDHDLGEQPSPSPAASLLTHGSNVEVESTDDLITRLELDNNIVPDTVFTADVMAPVVPVPLHDHTTTATTTTTPPPIPLIDPRHRSPSIASTSSTSSDEDLDADVELHALTTPPPNYLMNLDNDFDSFNFHNFTPSGELDEDEDDGEGVDSLTMPSTPGSISYSLRDDDVEKWENDVGVGMSLSAFTNTDMGIVGLTDVDDDVPYAWEENINIRRMHGAQSLGLDQPISIIRPTVHQKPLHQASLALGFIPKPTYQDLRHLAVPPSSPIKLDHDRDHEQYDEEISLSPFTPIGSPFSSSPSSDRSFDMDQGPFLDDEPMGTGSGMVWQHPTTAVRDDGVISRENEGEKEEMGDLMVGPEGVQLDELEEAWGAPRYHTSSSSYPLPSPTTPSSSSPISPSTSASSSSTLDNRHPHPIERRGSICPCPERLKQMRYSPGMCVPMPPPPPCSPKTKTGTNGNSTSNSNVKTLGRPRSLSLDRRTRGTKRVEPDGDAGAGIGAGAVQRRVVSCPGPRSSSAAMMMMRPTTAMTMTAGVPHLSGPFVVQTIEPLDPVITATMLDTMPVYSAVFESTTLLRRLDTDFVNLSSLLSTCRPSPPPSTMTTLLSSSLVRHDVPASPYAGVSGVWVPLNYVQDLCAHGAVHIPSRIVDSFLSDGLADMFPAPVPFISRAYKNVLGNGNGMLGVGGGEGEGEGEGETMVGPMLELGMLLRDDVCGGTSPSLSFSSPPVVPAVITAAATTAATAATPSISPAAVVAPIPVVLSPIPPSLLGPVLVPPPPPAPVRRGPGRPRRTQPFPGVTASPVSSPSPSSRRAPAAASSPPTRRTRQSVRAAA